VHDRKLFSARDTQWDIVRHVAVGYSRTKYFGGPFRVSASSRCKRPLMICKRRIGPAGLPVPNEVDDVHEWAVQLMPGGMRTVGAVTSSAFLREVSERS
jgi:hypothetical protein